MGGAVRAIDRDNAVRLLPRLRAWRRRTEHSRGHQVLLHLPLEVGVGGDLMIDPLHGVALSSHRQLYQGRRRGGAGPRIRLYEVSGDMLSS